MPPLSYSLNMVRRTLLSETSSNGPARKNASALQYHFGSKAGLIEALHIRYYSEELECRAKLAEEIFVPGEPPTARKVATLMVRSTITMMSSHPGYAKWAGEFSHVVAERGFAMYREAIPDMTADVAMILNNLFIALPDITQDVIYFRLDQTLRFLAIQSSVLAKNTGQYSGELGALSEAMLIDSVTALFEAEVSDETIDAMNKLKAALQADTGVDPS